MIRQKNPEFASRLKAVLGKLGWHYAAITHLKYPKYAKDQIRSVAIRGVMNWEILKAMEDVAGLLEPVAQEL